MQAFKASVDTVILDKQARSGVKSETQLMEKTPTSVGVKLAAQNLTYVDKRRVLETFVENDEALGQLLDFISTRSGSEAAP